MTASGSAAVGAGRSPAKTRKPSAFLSAIQHTSSYASGEPSMSCACARTILATEFDVDVVLVDALRVHGQRLLEQVVDGEVDRIRRRAGRAVMRLIRILRRDVDLCLADRVDVLEVAAAVEVLVGCREVVEVHAETRHEVHVGLTALVGVDRDGVIARTAAAGSSRGHRRTHGFCENRHLVVAFGVAAVRTRRYSSCGTARCTRKPPNPSGSPEP